MPLTTWSGQCIRPPLKMMVYTIVPSFSSTVEEFLTGSGFLHSTCDPRASGVQTGAYQNRGAPALHEPSDDPDGRSGGACPGNQWLRS